MTKSARETALELAGESGWTPDTILGLAYDFIDEHDLGEAWREHLRYTQEQEADDYDPDLDTGWEWEFEAEIRTGIDDSVVWSGRVRVKGFEDTDDNEPRAAIQARKKIEERVEYDSRINPSIRLSDGMCISVGESDVDE